MIDYIPPIDYLLRLHSKHQTTENIKKLDHINYSYLYEALVRYCKFRDRRLWWCSKKMAQTNFLLSHHISLQIIWF